MSIRFTGTPREVHEQVRDWLGANHAPPLLVETSGSTGEPKQVQLSREALVASARASIDRLGGPGRWLAALPTTSVGGLQVMVRSVLGGVEPVFLAEHDDPESALADLVGSAERTYASFVPTQLFRLIEEAEVLSGLDAVLLGGAAAPAPLLARAAEAGVRVVRSYGMTETSGGCVYDGAPLEGVRLRIGAEGRVEIAGVVLFDGYVGHPPQGEWFTTSDLGELDADGRLRVLGRADDVAISGGVNVILGAVERALGNCVSVEEVAVVGLPDAEWGERITAFVVGGLDLGEARRAVELADLPPTWSPKEIRRVESLPRLPGGKVDKRSLA